MVRVIGKSIRILLVEDDQDTLRAMYLLLTKMGYIVKTASTMQSAIDIGLNCCFDLAVCDIRLPDGDGVTAFVRLSENHPIKGIAVSADTTDGAARRSLAAGFDHHLVKPVDFQMLHMAIKRAVCNRGAATN